MGQKTGQKIVSHLRPVSFMIAARDAGREAVFVAEPLMAKAVELGWTDVQTLCGRKRIQLAGVEGGENFLDEESWHTMGDLFFFMGGEDRVLSPEPGKFFALEQQLNEFINRLEKPKCSTGEHLGRSG